MGKRKATLLLIDLEKGKARTRIELEDGRPFTVSSVCYDDVDETFVFDIDNTTVVYQTYPNNHQEVVDKILEGEIDLLQSPTNLLSG